MADSQSPRTHSRTGGEAVVQSLIDHGIKTFFGLPGIQCDWLYNALYEEKDRIRVIHTRHEQGAAYMAMGHALATGEPSVLSVVPGPGVLNASAALATAYALNVPMMVLAGQLPSSKIGKPLGVLHEIPDQLGMLRGLTKWVTRVNRPEEAPIQVAEGFRQLRSGRPRPVAIELPMDVLEGRGDVPVRPVVFPPVETPVDQPAVEDAISILAGAKNPMIYVGSGAQGASAEVEALSTALQAPVVGYRTGRGVLDSRNPLSLFLPESHPLWAKADVILAVGSHLRIPLERWGRDDDMSVIRIDPDPTAMVGRSVPDLPIMGYAEDILPLLLSGLESFGPRSSREEEMMEVRGKWAEDIAYLEPQLSYLAAIREALGEDGIFVDELTQVGFTSRIVYPVYKPRTFISTGYQGTLGYGFQTALGVKVARPDVPVVSVTGDGGFMFGVQELATAVQHKIGLATVVFNNGQFGNVQQMQKVLYGGRVIASDLHNPDFVTMAESFGAMGLRANSPDELKAALRKVFEAGRPAIIECPVGDMPSVDRFRALPRVRGGK